MWYTFGDSMPKGKKNDHAFHNMASNRQKSGLTIGGGQNKCNQNFLKIATSSERTLVELDHSFAQKYGFKGVGCHWESGKACNGK
jgi:hypothetical protein